MMTSGMELEGLARDAERLADKLRAAEQNADEARLRPMLSTLAFAAENLVMALRSLALAVECEKPPS